MRWTIAAKITKRCKSCRSISHLDELGSAGLSSHNVGDLEVELQADGLSEQHNRAARRAQVHVVQINTHGCGHRGEARVNVHVRTGGTGPTPLAEDGL